jgi:tetratricopeptide (TPR) repeat protein
VRWNPFRRSPAHSRDAQLAERAAAAEAGLAAGRYELAHAEFAAVVDDYRAQLVDHPDDPEVTALLAARLDGLGVSLQKLRRFDEVAAVQDEAVGISRRAVELCGAVGSGGADPDLARALRTFGLVRAHAGVELDEAEQALTDAMAVHLAVLTAAPSQEHLAETYATELAQAQLLARQGKHVEAARTAELARSGHLDGLLDMLRAQRPGEAQRPEETRPSDVAGP